MSEMMRKKIGVQSLIIKQFENVKVLFIVGNVILIILFFHILRTLQSRQKIHKLTVIPHSCRSHSNLDFFMNF